MLALVPALVALALAGCATAPRLETPPVSPRGAMPVGFTGAIRAESLDVDFHKENMPRAASALQRSSDGAIDMLALSGGGAGGAFGAGVLIGLTSTGARPTFEIVTGVSTGALIAPMAFLGPDWDGKLAEAYRGEATSNLMVSRGLASLWEVGVFDGRPLRDLVNRFVTDDLVAAVARESLKGRVLLVATTNLDREETVIWNMGLIAQQGGAKARELFRDVLVASASVPGVFPPVMIDVEKDGKKFQEMHVDGGATTPFFIAPEAVLLMDASSANLRRANIYVIVNGQTSSAPRTTSNNTVDIAARSFTSVLNHLTRAALEQSDRFARSGDMGFRFTAIPSDVQFGGSLAFERSHMAATFDYGVRCAARGQVWLRFDDYAARPIVIDAAPQPFSDAPCPVQSRTR